MSKLRRRRILAGGVEPGRAHHAAAGLPMIRLATGAVLGMALAFAAVAGAGVYLLKRDELVY